MTSATVMASISPGVTSRKPVMTNLPISWKSLPALRAMGHDWVIIRR
jgi:hypothetical protein